MDSRGFTLIELMVVMGIALITVTGAATLSNTYLENQRLKQTGLTIKSNLRLAQSRAQTGLKPFGVACSSLLGYTMSFTASTYQIQANCAPEGLVGEVTNIPLPAGVTFQTVPPALTYRVLNHGMDTDVTITVAGLNKTYQLIAKRDGDVTDLGFQ